jgi:hypothetical protein
MADYTSSGDPERDLVLWQQHFGSTYIPLGVFVRGVDLSGTPCAGVVTFEGGFCRHLELDFPGKGDGQFHVNAGDLKIIPDEELTAEELSYAQNQRRFIGSLAHITCSSLRGCPQGRALLQEFLNSSAKCEENLPSSNSDDVSANEQDRDAERRAKLREMIRVSEELGLYEIEEFELESHSHEAQVRPA